MSYLNDPREMAIRPESGVTLEEDNRIEEMWHWGAAVLDLCNLPVEEYMKPMTVNVNGGGGSEGGGDSSSTTKTYALKFYLDGRQTGSTYKLEEGAPIPEVSAEKEGYDFSGWADASGNTYTTMPASNLTLYGTNTIKKFNISFRVDNEALTEYDQIVEWGKKVTNIPSSSKTGYEFSGWEPEIPASIKQDYVFNGTFTKKSYTVSFNISGEVTTAEYEFGDTIVYPQADAKEGYTICGWTPYYEVMPDNENLTFNAVLSANEYTVKYLIDFGGGADNEVVAEYVVKYGQNIPSVAVPSQSGYSFTQWSADTQITNNKMPASDVNFYTTRSTNNYTLSYFIDGAQDGETETYAYGAGVTPRAKYEKEGYTVTDWAFDHALGEVPQELGGGYSMPYYNVVASCQTSINSYNVVIKHDNEVIYSGSVEYGTEISTLIPEGYSYSGEPSTVPADNVEISADINSYDITVSLEGKEPFVLELEYKSDIESAIEDYINEHYPQDMVGHHIETNVPDGETVPAHDANYTASIVPNEHTITVSGGTDITINYGEDILEALEDAIDVDEYHYLDGWTMNGEPIVSGTTMPDEDVVVAPVIKVKEAEVTPVVSGETSESGTTYDYGTPVSEVIEDIIESLDQQTQEDLEDPGYNVEWTVNGSAYTEDMVVKEDEVTVEVSITPKPFMLSFMRRGTTAAPAGVIESGETLYKEEIVYPELPANIEVSGVTYEFKWDDGSIEEGTPMPSRAVVVYGEYVEKPLVRTIYYGSLNFLKFSGFTENSPEFAEFSSVEGMPSSKEFPFLYEMGDGFEDLYDSWQDEDIEDDEYFDALRETYAASPIILFPESISKNDYNWKRDLEPVTLEFAKNITISGNTYEMWYEPHNAIGDNFGRVEGYVSTNSVGIDATIKFENK